MTNNIIYNYTPPTNPSLGSPGDSSTLQLPWDPNGTTPNPSSFEINWNSGADSNGLVLQIEQQYEQLVTWIQNNPGDYNGYLALLDMTLDIGSHMSSLPASAQQQLSQFMNNQMSSQFGNTTLMQLIVTMAIEGDAVQNGQASADSFANQLTQELQGMSGYGAMFNNMYATAFTLSSNNDQGINNWISAHYVTFTDPATGATYQTWVNQNGQPITNFSDFANQAAFEVGSFLLNSANPNQYVDSLYETQIQQLCSMCKNPWELVMMLLSLINDRMNDTGQQMNGLSGNLNTLSQANNLVADMQNMMKNPTGTTNGVPNMQQFYSDFTQLRGLIEQDPNLSSLTSDVEDVYGVINGNNVAFPSTSVTTTSPGNTYQFTANQWVEYTPSGTSTSEYILWTGSGNATVYQSPNTNSPKITTINTNSSGSGTFSTAGTVSTAFTPWTVSAGMYNLPENVVVEYTPTGSATPEYLEWDGKNINVYSTPPTSGSQPTSSIPSTSGQTYLSGGTMTISPMDNPNLVTTGLTYGQLQGLGDYSDIANSVEASQTNYSSPVSSNNANVMTSLQTYFNSVAQPTQQEYSTDSSTDQTELSAFAQFLQAPIDQEQQITRNMAQAGN
ncbi:MAG: hypothetical protein JSS10_06590 [Verrucomicrobia bacterium]|nr:hypothetical protein [Verrucomicrobiota bacterium]